MHRLIFVVINLFAFSFSVASEPSTVKVDEIGSRVHVLGQDALPIGTAINEDDNYFFENLSVSGSPAKYELRRARVTLHCLPIKVELKGKHTMDASSFIDGECVIVGSLKLPLGTKCRASGHWREMENPSKSPEILRKLLVIEHVNEVKLRESVVVDFPNDYSRHFESDSTWSGTVYEEGSFGGYADLVNRWTIAAHRGDLTPSLLYSSTDFGFFTSIVVIETNSDQLDTASGHVLRLREGPKGTGAISEKPPREKSKGTEVVSEKLPGEPK